MKVEIVRNILKEQFEERRETAKKVYLLYLDEMLRLLGDPNAKPDISALERFIENEGGTFGKELAKVFADAIEAGYRHANDKAEKEIKAKTIPGVVCLADVEVIPDLWEFWDHFEQMLVRREWERFDREMEPEFYKLLEQYPDKANVLYGKRRNLMIRRERWAAEGRW